MADDQAAFGVYPHLNLKRRPENNNPEASKDMPLQFARGMVKTGLGAIPDLAQLGSDIYGGLSGNPAPKVPFTSEYWENKLPLPPTSFQGRLAGGLGEYFPENPVLGAVGHGIKGAAKVAGEGLSSAAMGQGPDWLKSIVPQPNFVIKPKGGNWLKGSIEDALKELKGTDLINNRRYYHGPEFEKARDARIEELKQKGDQASLRIAQHLENNRETDKPKAAINQWIDKNLTNYVKNQMGTEDDPVRKLAEQQISHLPKDVSLPPNMGELRLRRKEAGFPEHSDRGSWQASLWEALSDKPIGSRTAGEAVNQGKGEPWMEKADPFTNIYSIDPLKGGPQSFAHGLGFNHILDVLRQDVINGRLNPESLKNVSMEQAVRRVYEYDQEMAKKAAEAQIKMTEGMPTVKEYPTGHKWIELTKPPVADELPSTHVVEPYISKGELGKLYRVINTETGMRGEGYATPERAIKEFNKNFAEDKLADALQYEGDTMGHCVGGYCPDVISGQSRIFSLRDAKGEPHVTVEVNPSNSATWGDVKAMGGDPLVIQNEAKRRMGINSPEQETELLEKLNSDQRYELNQQFDKNFNDIVKEQFGELPQSIKQIKGKQNLAPKEQYLPFVQDFVKSGNWRRVEDLNNTGLIDINSSAIPWPKGTKPEQIDSLVGGMENGTNTPLYKSSQELSQKAKQDLGSRFVTNQEYQDWVSKQLQPEATQPPVDLGTVGGAPDGTPAMKKGGKVSITNNPDAMYMEVQDRKFAGGGEVAKMVEQYGPAFMEHVKHYANVISEMMPHLSAHEVMNQATDAAALKAKGMGVPSIDFHDPLAPPSMKMSEALGNAGAEGKTLNFTEADRSRVFGDNMGGVGFSALQHYSLPHAQANTVWGFGNKTVAEKKIKQNDPENTIWTTYAGSPEQHKSNTIVVKDAIKTLQDANNKGQVHPEQIRLINKRIQEATNEKGNPLFPSDFDITDPNALNHANTFERRSAVSDALMGTGVKKPMISVEFKKANPGVQWTDASNIGGILSRETEPVLANANTFDVGPHLFVMDNGMIHRPDLNEAFPYQVTGSDLGLKFDPTPIRAASPEFIEKKGYKPEDTINAWAMSRGSPSQFVSEQYLTNLQKQGYKKGGKVTVHHLDGEEVHIIEGRK